MTGAPVHLVTFRRGPLVFGIDVRFVRKVLRTPPLRSLPASPDFVPGGITVDDRLEVLVDAGRLFAPRDIEDPVSPRAVLVRCGDREFGLLADQVDEVRELSLDAVQPAPPFLGGELRAAVRGLLSRERDEILILDLERLLASETLASLRGAGSAPAPPAARAASPDDRVDP